VRNMFQAGILLFSLFLPLTVSAQSDLVNEIRALDRLMYGSSDMFKTGDTVNYKNGQKATDYFGQEGATWYWPNGQKATDYALQKGATWYYPSGQTITDYAGQVGATWYWPNGQKLTDYMGQPGATYYYPNGNTLTDSGPAIGEYELLNVPGTLIRFMNQAAYGEQY
jgi:hypothetical protein